MTLRALVADLVAIDSVNPELVPGGAGELEIARFIAGWLEAAGVETRVDEIAPGRANVIGVARGTGGGRTLLLNGHTDTVGHDGYERPLEPHVEGDRLYGRGGFDMKGGVAAAMWACAEAAQLELPGDVVVAAVCDEEFASIGTQAVAEQISADAAIVTEPTALEICVAHKGFAWLEVEIAGRAAHGSQPQLGVDAIAKAGRVLTGIENLGRRLAREPGHALLGPGSVHASLIAGGQEMSSYPGALSRAARAPYRARRGLRSGRAAGARAGGGGRRRRSRLARGGAHEARPAALRDRHRHRDRAARERTRRAGAGPRPGRCSAGPRGWTRRSSIRPASRP